MVVLVCGNSKDRKKKGKNTSGENEGDFEKIFSHNTKGGLKIGGLKPDNVKIKESTTCSSPKIVSGENCYEAPYYCVENVLSYSEKEAKDNYWLPASNSLKDQEFIVDLCGPEIIKTLRLVNTHNENVKARATRNFKVFLSNDAGSWDAPAVLKGTFEPPQDVNDPLPKRDFPIPNIEAKFAKFKIDDFYGVHGGGLQHFDPLPGEVNIKLHKECYDGVIKLIFYVSFLRLHHAPKSHFWKLL